jgi:hypothetical protein
MNQGTKWVLLMKKNKSKKSRASVPLSSARAGMNVVRYIKVYSVRLVRCTGVQGVRLLPRERQCRLVYYFLKVTCFLQRPGAGLCREIFYLLFFNQEDPATPPD